LELGTYKHTVSISRSRQDHTAKRRFRTIIVITYPLDSRNWESIHHIPKPNWRSRLSSRAIIIPSLNSTFETVIPIEARGIAGALPQIGSPRHCPIRRTISTIRWGRPSTYEALYGIRLAHLEERLEGAAGSYEAQTPVDYVRETRGDVILSNYE
jgi:hypothetical protein